MFGKNRIARALDAKILRPFHRLFCGICGKSAYRFAIRNWGGIDDINILADALRAETFRSYLIPQPLTIDDFRSVLVFAPHQDDEMIGAGGLLIACRERRRNRAVAFVTNGRQRNIFFKGRKLPPDETIHLRLREAEKVCEKLQCRLHQIGIDNISLDVSPEHVARMRSILRQERPELVLTPWLFDGSPKHRMANQLLFHALDGEDFSVSEVWGYQVNNTPFANGYFDITDFMEEKIELLKIYRSQNEGLRGYDHLAQGMAMWNTRFLPSKTGMSVAYAEIFHAVPKDEFMKLVRRFYLKNIESTYFGRKRIYHPMRELARHFGYGRA